MLVDDSGFLHAKTGGYWYRYMLGIPGSREVFADCDGFGKDICYSYILVMSPDRSSIYAQSYDPNMVIGLVLDVDPQHGSVMEVTRGNFSDDGLAVVPLRGDIDGDGETNLNDLEWFTACMAGPDIQVTSACELADMDADGDVELIDYRLFLKGYAAFMD